MKKFKWLFVGIILLYLIGSVSVALSWEQLNENETHMYEIEIHRLHHDLQEHLPALSKKTGIQSLSMDSYDYVNQVQQALFLWADETDLLSIQQFYEASALYETRILPVIQEKHTVGYLRLDYQADSRSHLPLVICEVGFLLFTFLILGICFYLYRKILRPFQTLSSLPQELAKGHLEHLVEESKDRYFGQFLWGIGMLQDTLEHHKKKELALAREKKLLTLSISHDIKTPLNAITLYAKALEQGLYDTDEEVQEAIQSILAKTKEINGYVQELMHNSTEDIITIHVEQGSFYVADLIHMINKSYSEKLRLRNIHFDIQKHENTLLKGDINRLYEVLGNLLENAVKYGDGKEITVRFFVEDEHLLIRVHNTGVPVPASELPHLFDSFYRGSNTDGKDGNGLGLYICREILKQMEGEIYAETTRDGMAFVVVCEYER